jgi:hypothetical protein
MYEAKDEGKKNSVLRNADDLTLDGADHARERVAQRPGRRRIPPALPAGL